MKLFYIFIIFACSIHGISAQIVLTPLPSVTESFRLDEAWHLQVIVSGNNSISSNLVLRIEDNGHNLVYASTLQDITFHPGLNNVQQVKVTGALAEFGKLAAANVLRQTGSLPYGEFIICYFLNDLKTGVLLTEYCYEKGVKPMLPPELLQPFNEEEIYNTFPLLVWKGPFPISASSIQYALRLVELRKGQTPSEAIEKNSPLLSRQYRDFTQTIYPAEALDLEVGKKYAWRISAAVGDYNIGTTEVWAFEVKEEKTPLKQDSYRVLSDYPDGNHFIAKKGILRFAYNNRYTMDALDYSISALSSQGAIDHKLQNIPLTPGINKIDLDLTQVHTLKEGEKYLLHIKQKHSNEKSLEFVYRKKD